MKELLPKLKSQALICPEIMKKYESPATTEEEKKFYESLIADIKEKSDYKMKIQEYIIFLKNFIYIERAEIARSVASFKSKSRSSLERFETPPEKFTTPNLLEMRDINKSMEEEIKIIDDQKEVKPVQEKREIAEIHELNRDFAVVYKGSYRDEEINSLYCLVCSLVPSEEDSKKKIVMEYRIYETVNITLHNISKKNRDPKVFTYSVSEILPDSGGEWMTNNYFELSDELHKRCSALTGHTKI